MTCIADELRRVAGKEHFAVHTGSEDLRSQMEMFARARIVVGAHGAGLSNLMFSDAGTRVILFPMKPHVDHTFAHLAAALDQKLYVISEIHSNYYGQYGKVKASLLKKVANLVEKLLGELAPQGAENDRHDPAEL